MKFQVEEDALAHDDYAFHRPLSFGRKKLAADFERGHFAAKPLDPAESFAQVRHVERDNDPLFRAKRLHRRSPFIVVCLILIVPLAGARGLCELFSLPYRSPTTGRWALVASARGLGNIRYAGTASSGFLQMTVHAQGANQVGHLSDTFFLAPLLEFSDQLYRSGRFQEVRRAHLDALGAHDQEFRHVLRFDNAAQPDDRNFHGSTYFMDHAPGQWVDRRD